MLSISILMAFSFTSLADRHLLPFLNSLFTLMWFLYWWGCLFWQQNSLCRCFSKHLVGLCNLIQPLFLLTHSGPLSRWRCPFL